MPRATVASSPPTQRAESTFSFSNSSKTTQGPTAVSETISSVAAALKLSSPVAVGSSSDSIT